MPSPISFGGISIRDSGGTTVNGSSKVLRFLGSVGVAQVGGETQITVGAGANIQVQDEGANVVLTGTMNFVGAGVTVIENPAGVAEVQISGVANLNFQDEGAAVGSFQTANFVGGGVTLVENPAGVAEITIPTQNTTVQDEGAAVVSTQTLNFEGDGVTVTEDPAGVAKISIPVAGELLFQDEGANIGTLGTINFVGSAVTVVENPAGVAEVTITPGTPTGNTNRVAFFNGAGNLSDNSVFQFFAPSGNAFLVLNDNHTLTQNIFNGILLGRSHTISTTQSDSLIAGAFNILQGVTSVNNLIGGSANTVEGVDGSLIGGNANTIGNCDQSLISGTSNNLTDSSRSVVGGISNTVTNATESLVCGDNNNVLAGSGLVIGSENTQNHVAANLLGTSLTSIKTSGTVVGINNVTNYSSDPAGDNFNVGVGAGATSRSAFGVSSEKRLVKSAKPQTEVSAQVLGAGFTIGTDSDIDTGFVEISAAGPVTSDGASAIETGFPGQHLYLVNTSANNITLQNGANVLLPGGIDLTLGQNDTLTLIYSTTLASWVALATSNN